ncbi:RNaseH domain-containing protein [Amycolatopsis nivea]|uniref:RNaseH domain-containing protein n=1 Tax=Amycolatopsis nivea TaxID=1644109 RepID=UPI00106FC300|nr:RNaseH domain-containing protein [Amycolatopsis nivea]
MLTTLAYRIPRRHVDELLGTVTAYPLTSEFVAAWNTLPGDRPTYGALAAGLVAATGKPVRLFGERKLRGHDAEAGAKALLLTPDDALDSRLRIAVRAWERHVRNGAGPVLAGLIPEPESSRPFSDFLELRQGHAPEAPPWVFRVAAWQAARFLAAAPLDLGSARSIQLRMDTAGRLVAWHRDDLIKSPDGTAWSMANVTVRLATRPGLEDLVLAFDAHLSRLDPDLRYFRAAWVERDTGEAPIPYLPVTGHWEQENGGRRWIRHFDPAIAAILAECELAPLEVPQPGGEWLAQFRPKLRAANFHALGSGLGPRFMARLHEHITGQLPLLTPLAYEPDPAIKLPPRVKKYPPEGITAAAVGPTGAKKLVIACLYRTTDARDRMFDELEKLTGVRPRGGDTPTAVHERFEIAARYCPKLLDHSTPNRAEALDELGLPSDPETLVAAWVETEYLAHREYEKPALDAKPHLRRLFAHRGIPTQFLATEPAVLPKGARASTTSTKQHAARAALRDLLRSAGVLDERMRTAIARPDLEVRLTHRNLLVGISARTQKTGAGPAALVLVLTAVLADPDHLEHWRVLAYSEKQRKWVRAADGVTDFHAGTIGSLGLGRYGDKATATRDEVERRLQMLVADDLAAVPVVVFVDAQATRSVWPGLLNAQAGEAELPGDTLRARGAKVSVVRSHSDMGDLGRPVTRENEGQPLADKGQPAAPGRKVYRLKETSVPSWLLAGTSITLAGPFGRIGTKYTRWTLPHDQQKELGTAWHAYTAREFAVVHAGGRDPAELAALAARLCEQPIAWDGRTLAPGPLHLSLAADRDHPEHRSSEEED